MTFSPDVFSPLCTGVFRGADVCLSFHLLRAVGWWCWVWCLAAGTGVLCPGLGTGREAWMSQESLEALDSLPLANWGTRTSLRLGLAEKGWPQVFKTSAYLLNQSRLSLWETVMCVECVSYPTHCSLCEGIISSCPSPWKASLAIERLWLQIEKEWQWSIHLHRVEKVAFQIFNTPTR